MKALTIEEAIFELKGGVASLYRVLDGAKDKEIIFRLRKRIAATEKGIDALKKGVCNECFKGQ
ncbi:MAG: hypothetical protein AB6733_10910 [Clostridiaceae bacterium]